MILIGCITVYQQQRSLPCNPLVRGCCFCVASRHPCGIWGCSAVPHTPIQTPCHHCRVVSPSGALPSVYPYVTSALPNGLFVCPWCQSVHPGLLGCDVYSWQHNSQVL